jgi:hypothetical protein
MSLKMTVLAVLSLSLAATTASAVQGTKDGGGGKGVLCDGRLRVLDIYEAEEIRHLPAGKTFTDTEQNLRIYGTRVVRELWPVALPDELADYLNTQMLSRVSLSPIPAGARLPLTHDATVPPLPSNCVEVQIAVISEQEVTPVYGDPVVHVDSEYWNMLDPYNQAALMLHESIYRYLRSSEGVALSDDTRMLIGTLMSETSRKPMFEPIWNNPSDLLICNVKLKQADRSGKRQYELYGVEERRRGQKGLAIYFRTLDGLTMLGRTQAFIPGASLKGLQSPGIHENLSKITKEWTKTAWNLEMTISSKADQEDLKLQIRTWATSELVPPFIDGACRVGKIKI